nr:complement C1s subcomponent [Pelodiscus sinensis]|eukprot:XP_006124243.1 complement C1s subcomponent [Pelodiscus sinensis]
MERLWKWWLILCCPLAWANAAPMYGEILSPNYPQGYPNDVKESWEISVPPGFGIRLSFTHLDIEPSQNCEYDSVTILSGGHPVKGPLCGRKRSTDPASPILEEFYAPYNQLTVTFQSDFSNEERFTGFAAYYIACTDFMEETCSHYCNNYIGGFFCSCPPEYFLHEDQRTCGAPSSPFPCPQSVTPNSVLDPLKDKYSYRDYVTVTCVKGYEVVTPQDSLPAFQARCQSNGEWSNSHYKCVPVDCGPPSIIANGKATYKPGSEETQYGATVRYVCEEPYYALQTRGDGQYQCADNGKWVSEEMGTELPVCICVCHCPSSGNSPIQDHQRIFGGTRAKTGNFPWQVLFPSPRGGGVLISERWVLTAAHVLDDSRGKSTMYAGAINIRHQSQDEEAVQLEQDKVFIHPGWTKVADPNTRTNFDNDIALVRLMEPVKMGPRISPLCLPGASPEYELTDGRVGYISGWGRTEKRDRVQHLMMAQIPVVTMEKCRNVKPESLADATTFHFTENMICAGGGRKDSCAGDSGGAFAITDPRNETRYYVGGLVSWGPQCGTYGLYTRVGRYRDWILETMRQYGEAKESQE